MALKNNESVEIQILNYLKSINAYSTNNRISKKINRSYGYVCKITKKLHSEKKLDKLRNKKNIIYYYSKKSKIRSDWYYEHN